jgi:hypothetical protein
MLDKQAAGGALDGVSTLLSAEMPEYAWHPCYLI